MFEQIVGQEMAVVHMTSALNNPVHTYTFYGPRGTYIEEAARIFASRLIDESGNADQRALSHLHADIIEFEPVGQYYRIKEDVRESMQSEMRKAPVEAKKKVLIVHDAHLLREDSANTLLKSLEEPPENIHWILIAPSIDELLPTIRSRSFAIHFARIHQDVIEDVLLAEGIEATSAHEGARASGGRIDRARMIATTFMPLRKYAQEVASSNDDHASFASSTARHISEMFDEISSDVIAHDKNEMDSMKKKMKDSGYADKIAQSIMTSAKARVEAREKRLKNEMIVEFLDALESAFAQRAIEQGDAPKIHASEMIEEYRKRLIFNPSDILLLESLIASIFVTRVPLNS
jgi:DNA polymerase-3 subunit delta'